jgi:hypothetical protein
MINEDNGGIEIVRPPTPPIRRRVVNLDELPANAHVRNFNAIVVLNYLVLGFKVIAAVFIAFVFFFLAYFVSTIELETPVANGEQEWLIRFLQGYGTMNFIFILLPTMQVIRVIRSRDIVRLVWLFGFAWFVGFVLRLGAENLWAVNANATEEELKEEPESGFVHLLY